MEDRLHLDLRFLPRAELAALVNRALAVAYGIRVPRLLFLGVERGIEDGNGSYQPSTHTITLVNKLSVLTYLHEFGHALMARRFGVEPRAAGRRAGPRA